MKISIDAKRQNKIVERHKLPSISKALREVQFEGSRKTAARDFLWNLKRIHHWWNHAQKSQSGNSESDVKELEIKIIEKK